MTWLRRSQKTMEERLQQRILLSDQLVLGLECRGDTVETFFTFGTVDFESQHTYTVQGDPCGLQCPYAPRL